MMSDARGRISHIKVDPEPDDHEVVAIIMALQSLHDRNTVEDAPPIESRWQVTARLETMRPVEAGRWLTARDNWGIQGGT